VPPKVIFNADDFGASRGVNRGIMDAHVNGVVTSASLMVTGRAVAEAVQLSQQHARLSVGLHWDVWGEDEREFDMTKERAVRDEFHRQLDMFRSLLGRDPTHVDTHRHAHLADERRFDLFMELVEPLGVPLRGDGRVRYISHFYAQWEWMVATLEYVGVEFLQKVLREEVTPGWQEIGCHPGYRSPDYQAVYLEEREAEVATLTDPRIRQTLDELGFELAGYADYGRSGASRTQ
jgi:predicted glycoside hydrolase/deacetylase ChbG (UPF0249 family)